VIHDGGDFAAGLIAHVILFHGCSAPVDDVHHGAKSTSIRAKREQKENNNFEMN
jgi:hypothetical protein